MIVTETIEDRAVKLGVSYFFAAANDSLADGQSIDILLESENEKEFFLRSMIIDADADSAEFEFFLNPVATFGSGTALNLGSRNIGASNPDKPLKAAQDPSLTSEGQALFPQPRKISGQSAPGNNAFMYLELLTGGYIIPKEQSVLFRITNTSGATRSFSVLISGRENI